MTNARPSCRRLLRHLVWFAASRARLRLGSRMLTSTAMMPMTTSSSTRVKPPDRRFPLKRRKALARRDMDQLPRVNREEDEPGESGRERAVNGSNHTHHPRDLFPIPWPGRGLAYLARPLLKGSRRALRLGEGDGEEVVEV